MDFLINYAQEQVCKPVLFRSADPYVEFIDTYLDVLSEYYLIRSEKGVWSNLMDKDYLNSLCIEKQILVPETFKVVDPCIVKPVDSPSVMSKFKQKMFKCYSETELNEEIIRSNQLNEEVLIQRIIPGFDDNVYTYDAYLNKESKVTHWITCNKQRQYPINFGASGYTNQYYLPILHDIGSSLLEEIGYKGFPEIEFKKDTDTGIYYLIEINVRKTTLNVLLDKSGINFPYIAYCDLLNIESPVYKADYNRVYAFQYLFEDILACKDYLKTNQLTFTDILKSLMVKKAFAIWLHKDIEPALSFGCLVMKKSVRRLLTTYLHTPPL